MTKKERELNNERTDDTGKLEFVEEMVRIFEQRMLKAVKKLPPKPEPISTLITPVYGNLISIRKKLFYSILPLMIYSLLNILHPVPLGLIISMASTIGGIALIVLVFLETIKGAGSQIQTEYKQGKSYSRRFKFVPSLNSALLLLKYFGIGVLGIILGFSGIYISLFRTNPMHFYGSLNGISAFYFTISTFVTVGIGDIYATSLLSRAIVSLEMVVSLFLMTIILATLISWVTISERKRLEARLRKRELSMQMTETLLREAKLGVYGKIEEIMKEAEMRVEKRKEST
ncbi:two pore domain potassium channel family protein [candidate division WOR-3 bacterium]|nr:two pore domain potassium channel family protein [candidate division WOR-3 bacterium]